MLSTCIITVSLCDWSSVHLNLPGNDQDSWPKFVRRLTWIIGALIAPEHPILTAWSQRRMAQGLSMEVGKTLKSHKKVTVSYSDPDPTCSF